MAKSTFNLGVTGMLAMGDRLAVIGNNIANSRTTAFKTSKLSFTEEFVTQAGRLPNGLQIQFGNGVRTGGTTSDWSPGSIEGTSNAANLAVAGDGFLPVSYQGSLCYTRAGDFALVADDASNPTKYFFERPNGAILLGSATANGTVSSTDYVEFSTAGTAPLQAPTSYEISPTGQVTAQPDDFSPATPKAGDPGMPAAGAGAHDWATLTAAEHTTYAAWATANSAYDPGWDAVGTVTKDWLPGNLAADGGWRENGGMNKIVITNGFVGVQRFNNPDSLTRVEGGLYEATSDTSYSSSNPVVPGEQGSGTLMQGSLENSNTDLITEFTDMIITQRAFQANSKTITTADEMLQTVLGLKR